MTPDQLKILKFTS